MPALKPGSHEPWLVRLQQRYVDRAARRMHDRLAAKPNAYRSAPSTAAVLCASLALLALALVGVAALVWKTFHIDGFWDWVIVLVGWAVALVLLPRPNRLSTDVVELTRAGHPGVHALVGHMAAAVGVRPPRRIVVTTDFNAWVAPVGWLGRPVMAIGLPLWTLESWDQRLGTLGHELGHLRSRDTAQGRFIDSALQLTWSTWQLLEPQDWDEMWFDEVRFSGRINQVVMKVLAMPFGVLHLALVVLSANHRQHREYLADRRAAEVVGTAAMVSCLSEDLRAVHTTLNSAAIRGEDPFAFLAARAPATAEQDRAFIESEAGQQSRVDDTHPPTRLRVSLLQGVYMPPGSGLPPSELRTAAEAELSALQPQLSRRFRDELRESYY